MKSCYWLAWNTSRADLIWNAEMKPSLNELKKEVWSLKTSPKIRTFLWRVLSGIVPVADVVVARGMNMDIRCQICGVDGESVNHTLFTCRLARQVWALSSYPCPIGGFNQESVYANMHTLLENRKCKAIPEDLRRSFPWILWFLWTNRNNLLFKGNLYLASEVVEKIMVESESLFFAQSIDENTRASEVRPRLKWKHPPEPWLKCNIGYTWSSRHCLGGVAWVLRDSSGNVKLHSGRRFSQTISLEDAKLKSILWTMDSLKFHILDRIVFGVEALELVGAVNRSRAWPSFPLPGRRGVL